MKVFAFAQTIALGEGLDQEAREQLETAAIVHDIGIKPSLEKYGDCAGPHQEQEGISPCKALLTSLGYPEILVDRVAFLVGHHHSYDAIDGPDYQILVEADFLVNILEGEMALPAIREVGEKIFRTQTGLELLQVLYLGGGPKE